MADIGKWLKTHKPEAALGGGGIVLALVLYARSKSSSSSGASGANQSYLPQTGVDTSSTDLYNALEGQIQSLQNAPLPPPGQPGPTGPTGPTGTPAPTPAPQAYNGSIFAAPGGGTFDILGTEGANDTYAGWEVGGGAPVDYYYNGVWGYGLSASQIAGLPAGTEVLTPTQYTEDITPGSYGTGKRPGS